MTRKDFELIAGALLAAKNLGDDNEGAVPFGEICQILADSLATTNPRFDRVRFLRACGLEVVA